MQEITSFTDKFRFLSNFYPAPVEFEVAVYPTVEHAYQAAKTQDPTIRAEICNAPTPGKAKRMGFAIKLRENWTEINGEIMLELLYKKFNIPALGELLLNTGDAQLIEGNDWGDTYWGKVRGEDGKWEGSNLLGKLLELVREDMRQLYSTTIH
jgi:ribA/ribD-fused uncharacterized protein